MLSVSADQLPSSSRPRWLVRLSASLSRWNRPTFSGRLLEPLTVAEELRQWARDDGRWRETRKKRADWNSLLDDVEASWSALGPGLAGLAAVDPHLVALRGVRAAKTIDEQLHRAVVHAAAEALHEGVASREALVAAAEDVFAAAERSRYPNSLDEDTHWRLAVLALVGEHHGHDWSIIADRIRRAIEWTHDQPVDATLVAVRRALSTPPAHGHSVVWLAIDHAHAWGPSRSDVVVGISATSRETPTTPIRVAIADPLSREPPGTPVRVGIVPLSRDRPITPLRILGRGRKAASSGTQRDPKGTHEVREAVRQKRGEAQKPRLSGEIR